MFELRHKRQSLTLGFLLVIATVGVYWPVVHHEFVNLDDFDYVTQNPPVSSGLTWAGVGWAFQSNHSGNWHPLTWVSHMLDAQVYGLNAGGHHFTNVLFHAANVFLLFLLLNRMTGAVWQSGIVAALFAFHPLHVESVAWVAERKDVLSAFFFMLTLSAYTSYVGATREAAIPRTASGRRFWYLTALLLFALGLMAKPMLVTLPCVLLLLDFWPFRRVASEQPARFLRSLGPLAVEKIPFFVLSLASSIVTVWAQRAGQAVVSFDALPFGARLINAFCSYLGYLQKLFWPADLSVFYPHLGQPPLSQLVLAGLLMGILSVLALRNARRAPFLLMGWLWYLGTLVPVIGLVQVGGQAMADRYMYLPSIGPFIMLVWGVDALFNTLKARRILITLAVAGAAACAVLSCFQLRHWKDGKTLFVHAREVTPRNYLACLILGNIFAQENRFDDALKFFDEAVSSKPENPEPHLYAGRVFEKKAAFAEAEASYNQALALNPNYPEAHVGLGSALAHQKRLPEALEHYAAALQLNPAFWEAEAGMGLVLESMEKFEEALPHLRRVVDLKASNPEAHFSLGIALAGTGQTNEARQHFDAALKLDPRFADSLFESGQALAAEGQAAAAVARFNAVLSLDPGRAEAHAQLGLVLAQQGQLEAAIPHFQEAIRLQPTAQAHYHLALACVVKNNPFEAIEHYRLALQLQPDWPEALNDLAWLLATDARAEARNGPEAVRLAERACHLTGRKQARFLGTLDAAYAEAGRFQDALTTARQTRELALAAGQQEIARAAQGRMKDYESNQPYRQK